MCRLSASVLALSLMALLVSGPVQAKKHEQQQAKDSLPLSDSELNIALHFSTGSRTRVQSYLRDNYRPHCPPGLAKKNNGCLPPGQAKKYKVGGFLPAEHEQLPHGLLALMGPPPSGTFYAMVDKDVLLVTEATKKVLDAITLLSAVQ